MSFGNSAPQQSDRTSFSRAEIEPVANRDRGALV
jgi:hypothetical protein